MTGNDISRRIEIINKAEFIDKKSEKSHEYNV